MVKVVKYGTSSIHYRVKRGERRTIAIEVHPDGVVQVVAPSDANENLIHSKVEKRASWISKQIRFFESAGATKRKPEWVSGETIYYLGRQYRLKLTQGEEQVKMSGKFLQVAVANKKSVLRIQKLVEAWLFQQAKRIFTKRLEIHSSILNREKIKMNKLFVRKIQKRWGSCTKKGNIVLNSELVHASVSCMDYVIIHEICHLKHMNHKAKFWKLLSKHCPDWAKRKKRLESAARNW